MTGRSPTSTMACGTRAGVSNDGGERVATPVAAVVAAVGRGSTARQTEAGAIRMEWTCHQGTQGRLGQGEGGNVMGGGVTTTMTMMTGDAQQLHKHKMYIICLFSHLTSCRGSHTKTH
jgi:hypothetical protein